ncbi:C-terminal binding protein [Azospirillum sp. YIM B02556]|uniref:C-terminal binding protein n=1 Tax=Azospirillum endophyticum TaxID=2800326 RepID=A0ABS1FFM0_9PROT|nr:C-terminal binding protein [Azospirillum endophyticum]MBK1842229.1 C-terminal binding protein [Azospirillum endophyticum]
MTHPLKVLVPDVHLRDLDVERGVSGDRLDYLVFDETDPAAIPDEAWRSCDAILVWHRMRITPEVVAKLDKCRLIVRVGVGFDNVDGAACRSRGIPVCNVPNYGTSEVADHALAMLLHLVRGLGSYEKRLRADLAAGFLAENVPVVRRIRGATFGAVGMGRIGTAIMRRAAAFDMTVIYVDPYLPEGHELGLGIERVKTLPELLSRSDVVSLHVPLSERTRNIIGKPELALMKPGGILLNIARGGLVDVDAVHDALKSGHLAAAGLDVLPKEPPMPPPPLIAAWQAEEAWLAGRLVLTPHAAFYSEAGYRDMRVFSAEILLDFLFEGRLRNNVNPGWDAKAS